MGELRQSADTIKGAASVCDLCPLSFFLPLQLVSFTYYDPMARLVIESDPIRTAAADRKEDDPPLGGRTQTREQDKENKGV